MVVVRLTCWIVKVKTSSSELLFMMSFFWKKRDNSVISIGSTRWRSWWESPMRFGWLVSDKQKKLYFRESRSRGKPVPASRTEFDVACLEKIRKLLRLHRFLGSPSEELKKSWTENWSVPVTTSQPFSHVACQHEKYPLNPARKEIIFYFFGLIHRSSTKTQSLQHHVQQLQFWSYKYDWRLRGCTHLHFTKLSLANSRTQKETCHHCN